MLVVKPTDDLQQVRSCPSLTAEELCESGIIGRVDSIVLHRLWLMLVRRAKTVEGRLGTRGSLTTTKRRSCSVEASSFMALDLRDNVINLASAIVCVAVAAASAAASCCNAEIMSWSFRTEFRLPRLFDSLPPRHRPNIACLHHSGILPRDGFLQLQKMTWW
jgi:hypothetical protein